MSSNSIFKSGNFNSGSWKNKQPRFAWTPTVSKDYGAGASAAGSLHDRMSRQQRSTMTEEQTGVLDYYTNAGYEILNKTLRGKHTPDSNNPEVNKRTLENIHKYIDTIKGLAKPLAKDLIVYRGLYSRETSLRTAEDKGFTSTSLDEDIASMYFGPVVARIHLPKGTLVVWGNKKEREVILMPGSKFSITRVVPPSPHSMYRGYEMEYLGRD